MEQRSERPDNHGNPPPGVHERKPYRKPGLIEYGSVAKLTQGVGSKGQDAQIGSMTMNCL